MAWFEYLTDSLKKFFLKKSISDFENETENEEERYDPRFNDTTSEERGIKIKTYYEKQWLARGLTIKYIQFVLPQAISLQEPNIEIPLDDYRSFSRQKRSELDFGS